MMTTQSRMHSTGSSQRACLPCRKRKSRCRFDWTDPAVCLMCKVHETSCFASEQNEHINTARTVRPSRSCAPRSKARSTTAATLNAAATTSAAVNSSQRLLLGLEEATGSRPSETPFRSRALMADEGDDDAHVIGPVLDAEAQSIENYLANGTAIRTPVSLRWWTSLGDPLSGTQPVAFNKHVRRRPLGVSDNQSVAFSKCDIVERLIGPFCNDVIDLYFAKEHVCFPILDEPSFRTQYSASKERMSPTLLACIYAHTLVYWKHSPALSPHHCPENRFVWNQATDALFSELHLSPGISTIITILLNVAGRPLIYMIGNGILLGSAVSLAYALGLNRDCSRWNIDPAEKCLRTRLWWGLVIHDKWSEKVQVAYGTPPRLRSTQHDVQNPSLPSLFIYEEGFGYPENAPLFLALVTLTKVLDKYLEDAFSLQAAHSSTSLGVQHLDMEAELAQWENMLPVDLRRSLLRDIILHAPGLPNLRLAYLYVKLLSRKHVIDRFKYTLTTDPSIIRTAHLHVRRAAEEIVFFVQELDKTALADFWFPLNAFALSATVASLLRCALELEQLRENGLAESISVPLAQDLLQALQAHRQSAGWDLGDICIAQYSEIVQKLLTSSSSGLEAGAFDGVGGSTHFELFSSGDVNWPFPELWELFTNR